MHRHSKIWLIVLLISTLVLAPVMPVVAAAMAPNQDVAPMHGLHQKSESGQVMQDCVDLAGVSQNACASQFSVACSVVLGILKNNLSIRSHTISAKPIYAVHPYTPITLASEERPPKYFG